MADLCQFIRGWRGYPASVIQVSQLFQDTLLACLKSLAESIADEISFSNLILEKKSKY